MADCDKTTQASLYHDGELDDAARDAFEHHLTSCVVCQNALADFRAVSTIVGSEHDAVFETDIARKVFENRMHEAVGRVGETRHDRLLFTLSALAAMWLISVASFGWYYVNDMGNPDTFAENWVEHMITEPEAEVSELEEGPDETIDFAHWMNRALSEEFSSD